MPGKGAFIRSPAYPSMALREAVAAVAKIEGPYRSAPVDRVNAAKLIGFSSSSGPAGKALADLASYGLLERAGNGSARVTERARDILHPSSDQHRRETLRAAALEPPLFRQVREHFSGIPVPPEAGVVTYRNQQGFNPNAVRPAARAFLQTMSYLEELGASDSDGNAPPLSEDQTESGGADDPPPPMVKLGDYVQWTSGGVDRFPLPLQVVNVFPDGKHAQVFGNPGGIPMSELTVVDPPSPTLTGAPGTAGNGNNPKDAAPIDANSVWGRGKNDVSLLQRGTRLQITADVDLDGIADLKAMLDDYESILRRLAGKTPN